jgi:hypothetical protein
MPAQSLAVHEMSLRLRPHRAATAGDDRDIGTRIGVCQRDGPADAASTASDERYFASEWLV